MTLSIVITTFDRTDLLRLVLEDLRQQEPAAEPYEVIVVDNAGQAACATLVDSFAYRYVVEKKVGHCHARNRGLEEARAPWVLYFDDDVRLPPDLLRQFLAYLPQVKGAAFGGAFHHWYLSPPPAWLLLEQGKGKFPGRKMTRFGVLPEHQYLIGCFFAVAVKKVQAVGGFDPALGMQGKEVGWADETELQFRLRQAGEQIYYAPELRIEHLVQPWKCTFRGQLLYAYSHGKMSWLPQGNATGYGVLEYLQEVLRVIFIVFPVTLLRWGLKHREWHWQNVALRVLTKLAFASGRLNKRWKVYTEN